MAPYILWKICFDFIQKLRNVSEKIRGFVFGKLCKHVVSSIIDYNKNVEDYLMQFGYLPKSNFAESMRSHQQIENAVKNLQFFAGLNITGHIDDFTLDLMAKYVHFCCLH